MNTNLRTLLRKALAYTLTWCMVLSGQVYAVIGTELASEPLSQPASNIPPNIMLLFDDSGSMMQQYTPDYIGRYSTSDTSNAFCLDSHDGDGTGDITDGVRNCEVGDLPLMSPDINTQYYNPEIRYQPAVNYDGSEKNSMTCANTGGTVSGSYCTNGWTSVATDSVSLSTVNTFRNNTLGMMNPGNAASTNPASPSAATQNLVTAYPDRVWCTSQAATVTDTSVCKTNSSWIYPDMTYGFGWSTGSNTSGNISNVKRITGAPYYYRLSVSEYCTDQNFTTCTAATAPTTVGATAYNYPALVRYCSNSTLTSCQAKYNSSSFPYPKYAGNVNSGSAGVAAVAATGSITVSAQADTQAGAITAITINGTNIIAGTGTCGDIIKNTSDSANTIATAIRSRIQNCVSSPLDFTAGGSGAVVSLTAVTAGTTGNGSITVTSAVTSYTATVWTVTVGTTSAVANPNNVVAGLQLTSLPGTPATHNLTPSNAVCPYTTGSSNCSSSVSAANRITNMATKLHAAVTALTPASGTWTRGALSSPSFTITSPTNANYSGATLAVINQANTSISVTKTTSGGVGAGDVQTSTVAMTGGTAAIPAVTAYRQNVGNFTRTDIANTQYCTTATRNVCVNQTTPTPLYPSSTYPYSKSVFTKASGRADCTSTYCTYEEEMTNFANWFTYYRSRSQMAKTAAGRAFVSLGTSFRVGFVTIAPTDNNPPNTTSTALSSRFLASGSFNTSQKSSWFDKLYGTIRNNVSTPNRTALSRVGMYYGNMDPNGMGASPMTYSCQSNYTVLVTDGYWNDTGNPWKLDGTAIGNQDFNLSATPRPQYDGTGSGTVTETTVTDTHTVADQSSDGCTATQFKALRKRVTSTVTYTYSSGNLTGTVPVTDGPAGVDSLVGSCQTVLVLPTDTTTITTTTTTTGGSSNSLSDVAAYYYNTDLRPDMANEVPIVGTDTASHQHMTTFTVGLGLAGTLNYDANYLTQTTGDYKSITQGTLNWPVPAADAESALDDTWHAAVNGHGQFFSAKDPAELSASLTDTLNSVASRVGAGAAAATSNLQPVAGDNFAFTAQYQTVDWTGDLTAKTIDLSTGTVSTVSLWSAATQLDLRNHYNRNIYTFDAGDTTATGGQNGNKLKSFCWAGAPTATYTTCTDGTGLTTTELNYFDPTTLSQALGWSSDGSGRLTAATKEKLVDFLRGDTSNEIVNTTGGTTSDLFRNRVRLLGDIISAQPAYVKSAPFGYGDAFYTDFKNDTNGTTATRKGTVYVAANDGMLHAFETDPDNSPYYQDAGIGTTSTSDDHFTGTKNTDPIVGEGAERWAYIPAMVMPNLKVLADNPYTHQYFVDGSPAVGDVCFGHTSTTACSAKGNWHTILVGGLNAGGRGFYALDVTDPDNPKGLWELKGGNDAAACLTDTQANMGTSSTHYGDCNLGYSFGNPLIVKRKEDGRWVVLLTSGYNNFSPGDGKGYLYIIDAETGKILNRLGTGVGCQGTSTVSPCISGTVDASGLSRINAWVDDATADNTALRVYGGDLKGNVWRFQLDPSGIGGLHAVHKLVTVTDGTTAQPITTKPELALVSNYPTVYVTTGRLLGQSDKATTPAPQVQSVYAIRDDLSNGAIALRTGDLVNQTLSVISGTSMRTASNNAVDFNVKKGWYIDLPDTGERSNVDPQLQLGTLVVPTNVPTSSDCTAGGYGWLNFFDYKSGAYVPGATSNMASTKITSALIVGINVVQLPGGTVKTIVTTADNQQLSQSTPVSSAGVTGRRVSWRELFVE